MLLIIVLVVLLLALLGAALHPLALLVGALPGHTSGWLASMDTAKLYITDVLAWGFLAFLVFMGLAIMAERRAKGRAAKRAQGESPGSTALQERVPAPVRMAVAITAYNEAQAIAKVVEEFKAQDGVVEVIVIDNNSRDDTAALATAAGARVVRETRQGYGYACMRGLAEGLKVPGADVIVLTEGDGTFAAKDLRKFGAYIDQADMVLGTRVVPHLVENGSQMDRFFTWGNIAVGTLLRLKFWDTQFLGAARLSDVGCTYRAIRREALERILPDLVVGGHHFSPHMMVVALRRGLSIIEIPVTFRRRIGESKGASQSISKGLEVGLVMIWHIMTYRPRRTEHVESAPLVSEI